MKVLIDANVALDVILERRPWLDDSKAVWDACHETRIVGHLVATSLTNLFYVSRRLIGTEKARAGVRICLATFEIIPVGRLELEQADAMTGSDLEDNVSLACALAAGLVAIVTRDPKGFAGSPDPCPVPRRIAGPASEGRSCLTLIRPVSSNSPSPSSGRLWTPCTRRTPGMGTSRSCTSGPRDGRWRRFGGRSYPLRPRSISHPDCRTSGPNRLRSRDDSPAAGVHASGTGCSPLRPARSRRRSGRNAGRIAAWRT
jgi:predicted nucleic acid-binding protein